MNPGIPEPCSLVLVCKHVWISPGRLSWRLLHDYSEMFWGNCDRQSDLEIFQSKGVAVGAGSVMLSGS